MKAHFFNAKDSISTSGWLTTFKLSCDAKHIHQGKTMLVLPRNGNETLANALNSRSCSKDKPISTTDQSKSMTPSREKIFDHTLKRLIIYSKNWQQTESLPKS